MKVLVIGGCGFIGSHIVDALLGDGHSVRVLDRNTERFRKPLNGVEYSFGSFTDSMTVAEALVGVDVVMHTVSTTFPGTANLDPAVDVTDNLVSTIHLLDLMRNMDVPKIVFLSSGGTVYGIPETLPTPEDHPLRPINSYGIVKTAIEHYLKMYSQLYGLSCVAIRASNPYGERQGHSGVQGVVSTFLNRIRNGEEIEIWGDGSVVRDYLYVKDLAGICVRAAVSDFNGPLNAGSGSGVSLLGIIDVIRSVTGQEIGVIHKPGRPVDVPRSVLDITLAKSALGWEPSVGLAEGIGATWEWLNGLS